MKARTIIIEGNPFTYNDEGDDIKIENLSAISESDAADLLRTVKLLFEKCGLRFSLAYGTLLGAVRDNGIIKGDEDVDIFIDDESALRKNLPFLYENGLKVCRIYENDLYSFHTKNDSFVDVYIKKDLPFSVWSLWCDCLHNRAVPRRYTSKYDKINFLGVECSIPHKPERILEFWYGNNWRIPVKDHNYTYETPSRYWWQTVAKPHVELILSYLDFIFHNPLLSVKKVKKRILQ